MADEAGKPFTVRDGMPARAYRGTAGVMAYARGHDASARDLARRRTARLTGTRQAGSHAPAAACP